MAEINRQISLTSTWQLAWELFVESRRSVGAILVFVVLLPCLVGKMLLAWWSVPVVAAIKDFTRAASFAATPPNYYDLFATFSGFALRNSAGVFVLFSLAALAYFSVSKIIIEQQVHRRTITVRYSLRAGLALLLRRGALFVALMLIAVLEQLVLGPFHLLTIFAAMAPVLAINEHQGVWSSIKNAVLFKYTAPQTGGSFLSAFILICLGIIVFVGEHSLQLLYRGILQADAYVALPRSWWTTPLPGLPFSKAYAVADCLYTAGLIGLLFFVCFFTHALFFQVRLKISERY